VLGRWALVVVSSALCGAIPAVLVVLYGGERTLALLAGAIAAVCVAPLARRLIFGTFDIFEPIVGAALMLLLLFAVRPLWSAATHEHVWDSGPAEVGSWLTRASAIALIGSIVFVLAYELWLLRAERHPVEARPIEEQPLPDRWVVPIAAAMTLLGAGLWLYSLSFAGSFAEGLDLALGGRSAASQDALTSSEYLTSAPILGACGGLLILLASRPPYSWSRLAASAACFAVPCAIFTLSGGRRFVIPAIGIPIVLCALRARWRPPKWVVLAIIPAAFFVLILIPILRSSGARANAGGFVPAVKYYVTHPNDSLRYFIDGPDTENVLILALEVKTLERSSDYAHGNATIGDLVIAPIPSRIFPGKPMTARDQLLEQMIGSKCDPARRGCPDYSAIGSFYHDFGIPSVLACMTLLGLGSAALWRRGLSPSASRVTVLLAASWVVMLPIILRAGWMPAFAWWLYFVVPTVVALKLVGWMGARERRRRALRPASVDTGSAGEKLPS
jgi:hypothetical protein